MGLISLFEAAGWIRMSSGGAYLKNPTYRLLKHFVDREENSWFRGIVDLETGDAYLVDAHDFTHDDILDIILNATGQDVEEDNIIFIALKPNNTDFGGDYWDNYSDGMKSPLSNNTFGFMCDAPAYSGNYCGIGDLPSQYIERSEWLQRFVNAFMTDGYDPNGSAVNEVRVMNIQDQTYLSSDTVRVWKNPTAKELVGIVHNLNDVRGMTLGEDVYIWNAYDMIHWAFYESMEGYSNAEKVNGTMFVMSKTRETTSELDEWSIIQTGPIWLGSYYETYDELKASSIPERLDNIILRLIQMAPLSEMAIWHGTPEYNKIQTTGKFEVRMKSEYDRATGEYIQIPRPLYATDSRQIASSYADDRRAFDYQSAVPATIEIVGKMDNPLEFYGEGKSFSKISIETVKRAIPEERHGEFDEMVFRFANPQSAPKGIIGTHCINAIAYMMGYDGFIARSVRDSYNGTGAPSTIYAYFDPSDVIINNT